MVVDNYTESYRKHIIGKLPRIVNDMEVAASSYNNPATVFAATTGIAKYFAENNFSSLYTFSLICLIGIGILKANENTPTVAKRAGELRAYAEKLAEIDGKDPEDINLFKDGYLSGEFVKMIEDRTRLAVFGRISQALAAGLILVGDKGSEFTNHMWREGVLGSSIIGLFFVGLSCLKHEQIKKELNKEALSLAR